MKEKFTVGYTDEAREFIESLDTKVKEKILYNISLASKSNDPELFTKLNDDIWEFRTLFKKTKYRLFAFWDKLKKQHKL